MRRGLRWRRLSSAAGPIVDRRLYGRWHFRLEDSIKSRATYLSGDSIDQVRAKTIVLGEQVHGGISIDDIEALVVDIPRESRSRTTKEHIAEGAMIDKWIAAYRDKARAEYV